MKKMKLFPVVLIAIAFFTASCVDNTVSPQVEAIRGQQVEWMKAKTATELALAAMKTAEVDYQKALTEDQAKQTAFAEATRSWTLKEKELAFSYAKSYQDIQLAKAQNDLALAQATLKLQLANMAKAVAETGSIQEQKYYLDYQNQAQNLSDMYETRLNLQSSISRAKMDATTELNTLDQQVIEIQSEIDNSTAELATEKATLASLNAILSDPTTKQNVISDLTTKMNIVSVKIDSLNIIYSKLSNTANIANTNALAAQNIISSYNSYQTNLKTLVTQTIPNQAVNVEFWTKMVKESSTNVAILTTTYNQEKSNFDATVEVYNPIKVNYDAARTDYEAKLSTTNIALRNANNNVSDAKYIAAKAISDAAYTVFDTARTKLNDATNTMNIAANARNTAKSNLDSAQQSLDSNQAQLKNVSAAATTYAQDKAHLEEQIADLLSKYTDAVANYSQYAQDARKANEAAILVNNQISPLRSSYDVYYNTLRNLQNNYNYTDYLKSQIAQLKSNIAATEKSIADYSALLSAKKDSKALANDQVVLYTKQLEDLNTQITAAEKQLAYLKGLLDKALAA